MREGERYNTGRSEVTPLSDDVSDFVKNSLSGRRSLTPLINFGGITDCEGGGGWVSRTPFLSGTADYKSAPGKPTSQPPAA
jgi:hypothetical protein